MPARKRIQQIEDRAVQRRRLGLVGQSCNGAVEQAAELVNR
jgi:hypothetical protein